MKVEESIGYKDHHYIVVRIKMIVVVGKRRLENIEINMNYKYLKKMDLMKDLKMFVVEMMEDLIN